MDILNISMTKMTGIVTVVNMASIIYEMLSCSTSLGNWIYVASHDYVMILKYVDYLKQTDPEWKFNFYRDVVNAVMVAPWTVVLYLIVTEGLHFTLLRDYLPKPPYCYYSTM